MTDDPRNFLLSYAARISKAVVERLGKENVEAAFLSGGVARGEVASFRVPSGAEIYSDLDLFFVLRPGADLDRERGRAREAAAGVPSGSEGYSVFAGPDIGVFTRADFLAQKARPGTVEIAGSHVVLYGSDEIPAMARKFAPADIEPEEGLYLVENRLLELCALARRLEESPSDGVRRYARYVLWKSAFDAGSSVLIVLGRFHPSRAERMRRLEDAHSAGECSRLLPDEDCSRLAHWYGELLDLQGALERNPLPGRDAIGEAARVLLENWRRTASYLSGLPAAEWNALFEWRCKAGRWLGNVRELSIIARRRSLSRIRVLAGAGRLARLSPLDALRLSGAARLLAEAGPIDAGSREPGGVRGPVGYIGVVDDLTRVFGYVSGDVYERARRMIEDTR